MSHTPSRPDRLDWIRVALLGAPEGMRQSELVEAVRRLGWVKYNARRLLDDHPARLPGIHRLPIRGADHDVRWYYIDHYHAALSAYLKDRSTRKKREPRAQTKSWFETHRPNSVFDYGRKMKEDQ